MSTTIELITPIVVEGVRTLDDVKPLERPDFKIRHSLLKRGPSSIESHFEEALAVPDTVRIAIEAEDSGADAIVIDCMGDPGMHVCREAVRIPVLGAGQTSMHIANMLGHRFSFITVLDRIKPMVDDIIGSYGLASHYACFQSIDIPVLEIEKDVNACIDALTDKAKISIDQYGADAIILGCTGFLGCAEAMRKGLNESGYDVPVIDPIPATINMAEALVKSGLSHSKHSYPAPDTKRMDGYELSRYVADGGG